MDATTFCRFFGEPSDSDSSDHFNFSVVLRIDTPIDNDILYYMAARPADRRASFTGSGLPFPTQEVAMEDTPNRGIARRETGEFIINVLFPNTYYHGSTKVPPCVHVLYHVSGIAHTRVVQVGEAAQHRDLIHPVARVSADFYAGQFGRPVRSSERVFVDTGYARP